MTDLGKMAKELAMVAWSDDLTPAQLEQRIKKDFIKIAKEAAEIAYDVDSVAAKEILEHFGIKEEKI